MKTTQGKVTTAKSQFIALAREVNKADSSVVLAWLAVYRAFKVCGVDDKQAFARAFVLAVRGTAQDKFTEGTVRVQVGLIEWAEANIIGGAKACLSMNAIAKQRAEGAAKKPATKQYKVSTVTITNTEFAKALRKAGIAPELIALAEKAVFVTK